MSAEMSDVERTASMPMFRASKRRRIHCPEENVPAVADANGVKAERLNESLPLNPLQSDTTEYEDDSAALTQAMRLRAVHRARRRAGGKELTLSLNDSNNSTTRKGDCSTNEHVMAPIDNHFAPQSGQIAISTNRHMAEYIDERLLELKSGVNNKSSAGGLVPSGPDVTADVSPIQQRESSSALHGSHHDSTAQRLYGGSSDIAPRNAQRSSHSKRTSDAEGRKIVKAPDKRSGDSFQRDELVDALLQEHSAGVFGGSELDPDYAVNDTLITDDKLARDFQLEYLESIRGHNQPKRPPGPPAAGKDPMKGPKLGGSRSARAAMHAQDRAATKKRG